MKAHKKNSVTIEGYNFDGPFFNVQSLENRTGIYVILDDRPSGLTILDVGESTEIRNRIENHDRSFCWRRCATHRICVAVLYTTGWTTEHRLNLERRIRSKYRPTCGIR